MRPKPKRVVLNLDRESKSRFPLMSCVKLYWLHERGVSAPDLAAAHDISLRTCWRHIAKGRDLFALWHAPRLEVLVGDYSGAVTRCEHQAPIQVGERVVCCVCFVSGYDEVLGMKPTPKELETIAREGAPEPEPQKSFAERKHGGKSQKKGK